MFFGRPRPPSSARCNPPPLWAKFPDLFDAPNKAPSKKPAANAGESVETRVARIAWRHLRQVAAGRPIPPERVHATTQADARAALDEVENWCLAGTEPPPERRVTFDVQGCCVTLDGIPYRGLEHEAVVLLKALYDASPKRMKAPALLAATNTHAAVRVDRVFKKLPAPLKDIMDSKNDGYRIVLPVRSPGNP